MGQLVCHIPCVIWFGSWTLEKFGSPLVIKLPCVLVAINVTRMSITCIYVNKQIITDLKAIHSKTLIVNANNINKAAIVIAKYTCSNELVSQQIYRIC